MTYGFIGFTALWLDLSSTGTGSGTSIFSTDMPVSLKATLPSPPRETLHHNLRFESGEAIAKMKDRMKEGFAVDFQVGPTFTPSVVSYYIYMHYRT